MKCCWMSEPSYGLQCKQGDNDLSSVIDVLLTTIKDCEEQNKRDVRINWATSSDTFVNTDNVTKLVNDTNEDSNTMLHLATLGGHYEQCCYCNLLLKNERYILHNTVIYLKLFTLCNI